MNKINKVIHFPLLVYNVSSVHQALEPRYLMHIAAALAAQSVKHPELRSLKRGATELT